MYVYAIYRERENKNEREKRNRKRERERKRGIEQPVRLSPQEIEILFHQSKDPEKKLSAAGLGWEADQASSYSTGGKDPQEEHHIQL